MEIIRQTLFAETQQCETYLFALLFVAVTLHFHNYAILVPYGGPTLLPIYFFTLIAAYKYGFLVGLLTAILSPVINHLLFAMPSEAVLPILLIKSSLLAGASALAARNYKIGFITGHSWCRTHLSGHRRCI